MLYQLPLKTLVAWDTGRTVVVHLHSSFSLRQNVEFGNMVTFPPQGNMMHESKRNLVWKGAVWVRSRLPVFCYILQQTQFPYMPRNFENAPPSPASRQPAARADPAERLHYVVISQDGCKLVTRVRVMLP